ncbi:hypothetical protein EDC01DRAFT_645242 [Geopyxis carbonaria]|nr:hypothetical protein EDC01DRAFT_645242 [Geopyxis carbonaria]
MLWRLCAVSVMRQPAVTCFRLPGCGCFGSIVHSDRIGPVTGNVGCDMAMVRVVSSRRFCFGSTSESCTSLI